jgi:hypothetical protein
MKALTFDDAIALVDAEQSRLEACDEFVDRRERSLHFAAVGAFLKQARAEAQKSDEQEETKP